MARRELACVACWPWLRGHIGARRYLLALTIGCAFTAHTRSYGKHLAKQLILVGGLFLLPLALDRQGVRAWEGYSIAFMTLAGFEFAMLLKRTVVWDLPKFASALGGAQL